MYLRVLGIIIVGCAVDVEDNRSRLLRQQKCRNRCNILVHGRLPKFMDGVENRRRSEKEINILSVDTDRQAAVRRKKKNNIDKNYETNGRERR